jgi:hypothetical protein
MADVDEATIAAALRDLDPTSAMARALREVLWLRKKERR